jgi:type IV secretion system protein VirB2
MLLAQRDRQEGPLSRRFSSFSLRAARLLAPVLSLLTVPVPASAQAVRGADPAGSGPIVAALGWLQGTLLGNVATAVAVMAVAAVGFMMLTGRMNWRFGATVIIGCFILFGAGAIVSGIQSAAG